MTQPSVTIDDIRRVLSGDAMHVRALEQQQQPEIARVAEGIPVQQRTLAARAVQQVLRALLEKKITPEDAQLWASFVKRGHILSTRNYKFTIEIPYQEDREDAIVEALFRMDELGDLIDGTMDDDEIKQHIEQLGS